MGRYFGREPRYSQQEAEAQAKQAIEAAVSKGRPPEDDWKPLASRMGDIQRELVTRPPVEIPPPPPPRRAAGEAGPADAGASRPRRPMNQILRPPSSAPAPAPTQPPAEPPAASPAKRATRAAAPQQAPAKRATRATKAPAAKRSTAKKPPL